MAKLNMVQAINQALMQSMEKDRNVIVYGEDVGKDGGVFRVTDGLQAKFGEERVFDSPLAEAGIVGTALGMAAMGLRPVVEMQFDGFFIPAFDQMINHIGRIRNRSRGRFTAPLVVRVPYSGGIKALEHHSDSPETYMIHAPGIKVVVPATPYEAKGLLISALRDPDPVVFFEPKRVYRAIKEEVPEDFYTIPLSKGRVVRDGSDITVVAWGAMLKVVNEAVEKISDISVEIIDPRTLSPLDDDIIINSVKKTGRCVIVHEAPRTCGFGAELAARINEKALLSLEDPVKRVTGWDIIVPLPKMEQYYFPDAIRITKAIMDLVKF